jgi:ATP-dependent DNA helicase UvrD/PcrA
LVDACNSVIGIATERFTKNLRSERKSKQKLFLTTVTDETAQTRYVAEQILEAREARTLLKSQAVLTAPSVRTGCKEGLKVTYLICVL